MTETYDAVVCGAGIAGISAAYHLCVTQGVGKVLLVDERPPLSLTSAPNSGFASTLTQGAGV